MRPILALALLLAFPALAQELVAREGQNTVRLTQRPCPPEVLKVIPQGSRGVFRLALVIYEGKDYAACWAGRLDGQVHVQYDDGDMGVVPMGMFKIEPGI